MTRGTGQTHDLGNAGAFQNTMQELAQWEENRKQETSTYAMTGAGATEGGSDDFLALAPMPFFEDLNGDPTLTSTEDVFYASTDHINFDMDGINPQRQALLAEALEPQAPSKLSPDFGGPERSGMNALPLGPRGRSSKPGSDEANAVMLDDEDDEYTSIPIGNAPSDEDEEVKRWHQPEPALLQDAAQLWQPPPEDSLERLPYAWHHRNVYRDACRKIMQTWGCSAIEAMPEQFRASTPYSLAMLIRLRRFANHHDKASTHAALIRHQQARVARTDYTQMVWTDVISVYGDTPNKCVEPQIWENEHGLMLVDATALSSELQAAKPKGKKRKKAKRSRSRDVTKSKAETVIDRSRFQRRAKTVAMELIRNELFSRPPKNRELFQSVSRLPILSSAEIMNETELGADLEPQTPRGKGTRAMRKASEHVSGSLADAVKQLSTDERENRRQNQKIALRNINRDTTLPSERLSAADMTSLAESARNQLFSNALIKTPSLRMTVPKQEPGVRPGGGGAKIYDDDEDRFKLRMVR